jgi:VPDSG-CTERM motif
MKTLILSAIRCSLMFSAAAAFSLADPAKANLITNGGFETGDFTGWTHSSGFVEGETHGIPPHSGHFQAFWFTGALHQSVATTPGASYTISFFLAFSGVPLFTSPGFSVNWGGVTILQLSNPDRFGYRAISFIVTASDPSTELLFHFQTNFPVGGWHLDDVRVNPRVPDGGSTVSLLGCALLGLAALRRKLGC